MVGGREVGKVEFPAAPGVREPVEEEQYLPGRIAELDVVQFDPGHQRDALLGKVEMRGLRHSTPLSLTLLPPLYAHCQWNT